MNKDSIQSDFLAARAKTAITVMNATGWKQGVVNPDAIAVDSVFFYVRDFHTQWVWSCSIPKDAFYAALKQSEGMDQSASVAFCGHMIADCAQANGLNPDQENTLAMALTAYIGITKTYQATEQATKANHFAVIRYGATNTLRPFAMNGPSRYLIEAGAMQDAMQKVAAMDLVNHPDWIGKTSSKKKKI